MKKYWIIGLSFLLLTISCKKDDKDDLEGKWLLKEVIDADGIVHKVDTVWYNFQNTLFMYQLYDATEESPKYKHCYGFKTRESEERILLELTSYGTTVDDFLPYTDWSTGSRTFTVERVSGNQLILSSEEKQYKFHSF